MCKDLIERLRSVKWEVTDDGNRMPDNHTHKCVFVDMRPDDFHDLLHEVAAALAQQPAQAALVPCDAIPKHQWEVLSCEPNEYEPTMESGWQRCKVCGTRAHFNRDLLHEAATALETAQEDLIEWKEGNPPEEEVPPATVEQTETALLLVGDVDTDNIDVEAWTDEQRSLAYDWAMAVHFYASDNEDIVVPPRPDFIPRKEFNDL